ncbi:MAG: hypoxanthine phosphoribosyltransferase [Dehalococcoidales bacterium]|nr:hypoxanthine phosphoribosyltransferase [Dehalococcoidales bacterium]
MTNKQELKILFSFKEIEATVNRLAEQIRKDYYDKNPVIISILKGSFVFTADLVRRLDFPMEVEFVRLASYGKGQTSSGKIIVKQGLHFPIKNRNILIVEDIIDTGYTLSFLIDYLKKREPLSIKLCALADKPSRRQVPIAIDYLGFTVPNKFIVGYGIDYSEKYRYLPDICVLE